MSNETKPKGRWFQAKTKTIIRNGQIISSTSELTEIVKPTNETAMREWLQQYFTDNHACAECQDMSLAEAFDAGWQAALSTQATMTRHEILMLATEAYYKDYMGDVVPGEWESLTDEKKLTWSLQCEDSVEAIIARFPQIVTKAGKRCQQSELKST